MSLKINPILPHPEIAYGGAGTDAVLAGAGAPEASL